ncbi:MAG: hypothetical protein LC104_09590 [Bacteroidales bacterium]|nr:hypothetical protein [Bacteroidales bacterium]
MIDSGSIRVVPRSLLDRLAGSPPEPPRPAADPVRTGAFTSQLDVARWLTARGVDFRVKAEPDGRGRTVYILGHCPFHPAHADPDACVMQAPNGQMSAQCFHNSCSGQGWQAFKTAIGPPDRDHYDPPLTSQRRRPRCERPPPSEPLRPADAGPPEDPDAVTEDRPPDARRTIPIDPKTLPVAETLQILTDVLLEAGDCYRRTGQVVRVAGTDIIPVLTPPELSGLVNRHAEVVMTTDDGPEYRPLPTHYAHTWLHQPNQITRLSNMAMFTLNPVYTLDWRLAPAGYDRESEIYSAGPAVASQNGTTHLDALFQDFCFRTPGDRSNYIGILLTALLMPHFIGSKPAVLFHGNQPGLGKSVLAQIIAILRDGRPTETASYNPNDEEFEKRLAAIVRRGATTILIDNAKSSGRAPRIDSAVLERSITDPILSYRLLGQSQEIRAENSHIFCLTANTPELSRDLITRCVVVHLFHEGDPARRTFTIPDPETDALEHRAILLGELIGLIERWREAGSPRVEAHSRFNKKGWGPIIGGILAHNGYPDFLANAAEAAAELDPGRRDFADLVATLADHPQGAWTAGELAEWAGRLGLFAEDGKDRGPRARATRMGLLAGRFLGETFTLPGGRTASFEKTSDRKGTVYRFVVQTHAEV